MSKLSGYKKILITYSIVLVLLLILSLSYVYRSLLLYENNQKDKYINNIITKIKSAANNNSLDKYIEIENDEEEEALKEILKETKITYKEEKNKYYILTDDNYLFNLNIKEGKKNTRLGLLTFNELSNDKLTLYSDRGIYYYDIIIPSNFKLKVNDKTITEFKEEIENKGFEDIKNDTFPKDKKYVLDGLSKKPKIEIINNIGKEVEYKIKNNTITNHDFYNTNDFEEAKKYLVKDFDVLDFAQKWSLFMTKDLAGGRRGFNVISKYLIKDTKMWDRAYDWITGVDIEFVSNHTLKNPAFTNKKISNITVYNENSFSCLVHLEKNMVVKGEDRVDTMNDLLYFVYDDGWKIVDMKYVLE